MTPSPIDLLTDTNENDALDDEGDESSEALEHQALEPATEAFVRSHGRKRMRKHVLTCPMRRLRWWLIFAAGALVMGQVAAVLIVTLSLRAARAEVNEMIHTTVNDMLREKKLTGALETKASPLAHLEGGHHE